jgi:hypothetical protein
VLVTQLNGWLLRCIERRTREAIPDRARALAYRSMETTTNSSPVDESDECPSCDAFAHTSTIPPIDYWTVSCHFCFRRAPGAPLGTIEH